MHERRVEKRGSLEGRALACKEASATSTRRVRAFRGNLCGRG